MKKRTVKRFIIVFLIMLCCITGCGQGSDSGESADGERVSRRERTEYSLTENSWEDAGETYESIESWTVTDYWEEKEPKDLKAGMGLRGTVMTADGLDYYILRRYDNTYTGPGTQAYYLTCLNLVTLETEKKELNLLAAEDSVQEGIQELAAELAKDLDENWLVINGMSILDGEMRLMAVQMDRENKIPAHYYMIWMNEQGEMERVEDLLPEVKLAGMYQDGLLPRGLICDREGSFVLGIEENSMSVEAGIFDKDGKFVKKVESPNGTGGVITCTCRLADGRPVFECSDVNSEKTTIFYFDGQEEKVLYHGECEQTWARTLNHYGEILYLGYGGLIRWDAAEGGCQRIYRSTELRPIQCRGIYELSDDDIVVVVDDQEENYLLKLRQGADIEEKVLSVYQMYQDSILADYAEEYSAKHPGIRIEVTARDSGEDMDMAFNKLMAELIEGKGPDIFAVSREQMAALQEAGALEELSNILTEDMAEQIFPPVQQYGTVAGGLYGMPYTIEIDTVIISEELWQGETWNFKDMMELMENHKNLERVAENFTAGMLLFRFGLKDIQTGNSSLVDMERKECCLDTEEFVRLLEFCKKYGVKTGSQYVSPEEELENIQNMKTLTYYAAGNLMQFSSAMWRLGEGFHCVGFPTEGDYKSFLSSRNCICLNTEGENKEIAADFLQYMLNENTQKKIGPGTVRKDVLVQNVREGTGQDDGPSFMIGSRTEIPLTGKPDGSSFLPEYLEAIEKGWADSEEDEIIKIILEEAKAYFEGDKTAEETAKVIQSRVTLYLNEKGS